MAAPQTGSEFEQKGDEGTCCQGVDAIALAHDKAECVLFSNRICPFCHRVWWALHEKDATADYKYIHVDLGDTKPAWYKDGINHRGTLPCVYDCGRPVYESAIIMEYLEDKYPTQGTCLMPKEPALRAAVRVFVAELSLAPLYKLLMSQEEEQQRPLREACEVELIKLNTLYSATEPGHPFFLGEHISLADIALLPFIHRFEVALPAYRGYDLCAFLKEKAPRIYGAMRAAEQRPAFQATMLKRDVIIKMYAKYASGTPGIPAKVGELPSMHGKQEPMVQKRPEEVHTRPVTAREE